MSAQALKAYRTVDLESAPKTMVLDRLYGRLLSDIDAARVAIVAKQVQAKANEIRHGMRIVTQLRAALDRSAAPELCANLDSLYVFVIDRMMKANRTMMPHFLDEAVQVIEQLRSAFSVVSAAS